MVLVPIVDIFFYTLQVLEYLYCEICAERIDDVGSAYNHKCFECIDDPENLVVVGNIITIKDFTSREEINFLDEDLSVEYLDEYEEVSAFVNL